ncbi:MAG: hypothetical protein ABSG97_05485 [Sedimentisphaerales bacterium]
MSDWLNKMLGSDQTENFGKLVPLIIIFIIWVVGAISKAAQKGKKGAETKIEPPEEGEEHSFDDLARKIRQRYAEAKEQAEKNRDVQQGVNEQFQSPARTPQPKPPPQRRPEPIPAKKPVAPPAYAQEGPTLKVVKGLGKPDVGTPVTVEKPILEKVEPRLQKVEGITSDVPMVSTETEIAHKEHPYLAELVAQYATKDGFRKAILNYEILGPPIALRD